MAGKLIMVGQNDDENRSSDKAVEQTSTGRYRSGIPQYLHAVRGLASADSEAAVALAWLKECAGHDHPRIAGIATWAIKQIEGQ